MSVNVFNTKVLHVIGDTIFTSSSEDGTAILHGHPTHAKAVPSFLSYFKTLSVGPAFPLCSQALYRLG